MAVVVVYNSYTLPNVRGPFRFSQDYKKMNFSCNFVVESTSVSDLVSDCNEAEDALRERYKNFTLSFGGTSEYSFSHSDNTGLLTEPRITKVPNENATETSREYNFAISCDLPADQSGDGFRRDASFTITKGPNSGQLVKFKLSYTASSSPDQTSIENWNDNAETYCEGILSSLSGTFQRVLELKETEQEEKITTGTIEYIEILHNETEASLNLASLKNVVADYHVERFQDIGIPIVGNFSSDRRVRVVINYQAVFDSDDETVDTADKITGIYHSTIKPWIIKNSFTILGLDVLEQAGASFVIEKDVFHVDPYRYTINANIAYFAPELVSGIIALKESLEITTNSGITYRKLWDGKPRTYAFWLMGEEETFTRKVTMLTYDSLPQPIAPLGGNSVLLSSYEAVQGKRVGVGTLEDNTQPRDLFTSTTIQEYLVVDNLEDFNSALSNAAGEN